MEEAARHRDEMISEARATFRLTESELAESEVEASETLNAA